jgi:sulfur carrier protein ThiS
MKVRVKLFGTFGQRFPGHQHAQGMEVEIPDGATVKDLLTLLHLPEGEEAVVAAEGRILGADDTIRGGAPLYVLPVIHGG